MLPDVPVTRARGRCLSDHAAVVQNRLEALTDEHVGVFYISDEAAILASQAYPPPEGPQQPGG